MQSQADADRLMAESFPMRLRAYLSQYLDYATVLRVASAFFQVLGGRGCLGARGGIFLTPIHHPARRLTAISRRSTRRWPTAWLCCNA